MSYEQLIQLAIAREDNLTELMPAWDEPDLEEFNTRNRLAKPEVYRVTDV